MTTHEQPPQQQQQQQQQERHPQWLVRFQGKTHVVNLPTDFYHDETTNGCTTTHEETHRGIISPSSSSSLPLLLLQTLADRTGWPLHHLVVQSYQFPFVQVCARSSIRGGKGGFGTLLKGQSRQAGAKLTADFGACRDLQGRRLRHVNDEIKLRKFRERQRREQEGEKVDVDDLYKTPSGIYNWHLMTPTWADISKKAAHRIKRQFLQMEREDSKKVAIQKEKEEAYQKSMTMYLDETTSTSQSIQRELSDALKQGLQAKAATKIQKNRKRPITEIDGADDGNKIPGSGDNDDEQPNALVSLSGDVVIENNPSTNGKTSVQIQSKSEFMTAVMILDGEVPSSSSSSVSTALYYEVTLVTGGLAQIGWASLIEGFAPNNDLGDGVGDDAYSFAVDGSRSRKFHAGEDWAFDLAWKPGDRLGCQWEPQTGMISYTMNGKEAGVAFTNKTLAGLFPALSCNEGEILELHTSRDDCLYFPKDNDETRIIAVRDLLQTDSESKALEKSVAGTKAKTDAAAAIAVSTTTTTTSKSAATNSGTKPAADDTKLEAEQVKPAPTHPVPLDLANFNSTQELEALGLDRLKSGLMALQVKCGGTLEERAKRLFSLKGLERNDYPAKVRAKGFVE